MKKRDLSKQSEKEKKDKTSQAKSSSKSSVPTNSFQMASIFNHLQQTYGNRNVQRLIQPKLKISQPGDKYEQEADRIAEMVVRCSNQINLRESPTTRAALGQRQTGISSVSQSAGIPDSIKAVITSGRGRPLDTTTRKFMEKRFDQDFSQVRVQTNQKATKTAKTANAKAYTVGTNIVFAEGSYQPNSSTGRHLLAHELMHVIQQSKNGIGMQFKKQKNPSAQTVSARFGPYTNEDLFLRAAEEKYIRGELREDLAIYKDDYWEATAVGLSIDSFSVGLLPSDMGPIKFIYRFTGRVLSNDRYEAERRVEIKSWTAKEAAPPVEPEPAFLHEFIGDTRERAVDFLNQWLWQSEAAIDHFNLPETKLGGAFLLALTGNLIWALSSLAPGAWALRIGVAGALASTASSLIDDPRVSKGQELKSLAREALEDKYEIMYPQLEEIVLRFVRVSRTEIEKEEFSLKPGSELEKRLWEYLIRVGSPVNPGAIRDEETRYLKSEWKRWITERAKAFAEATAEAHRPILEWSEISGQP